MKVHSLTVGPILAAVTEKGARIFGRAGYQNHTNSWESFELLTKKKDEYVGVVRIRAVGTVDFGTPIIFQINPNFDMTGVAIINNLSPEQEYEYQIGWVNYSWETRERIPQLNLNWSEIQTYKFKSAATNISQPRSFILGSCRYFLRLFGGSWFDDRGDKTFRSILQQIDSGTPTDALLMVGDQIYADDLNFVAPDKRIDEFFARYREVFSQPYIRELMARIPTYMTLDDHEIEDNWPSKASEQDLVTLFPVAIHAYITYQLSHSPLFELSADQSKITGTPTKLWYSFSDGCCDFFVTDVRTERYLTDIERERQIISQSQMEAIKKWLNDGSNRIKFIASSVPFFPDSKDKISDKWSGFLYQRTELIDFIFDNKIKPVIFLSGDVHCSMSAEIISDEQPNFKVISVVSSAFFWPYPHTQASSFQLDGELKTYSSHRYRLVNAGPVHSIDNFTRVTVDKTALKVEVFSRKGELCGTKKHSW
ncbi:MAG: alkaline phosphatase D family protein [Nostocaceae cyanobacterium]|nr:alkaline phosphatase D family protein [Nostocaceae cyanobacterium]